MLKIKKMRRSAVRHAKVRLDWLVARHAAPRTIARAKLRLEARKASEESRQRRAKETKV